MVPGSLRAMSPVVLASCPCRTQDKAEVSTGGLALASFRTSLTRRFAARTISPSISQPTNRRPSPTAATAAGTVPDRRKGRRSGRPDRSTFSRTDRLFDRLLPLVEALLPGLRRDKVPNIRGVLTLPPGFWKSRTGRQNVRIEPEERIAPIESSLCRRSASGTSGPHRRGRP